jgi:hypothetical protein
MQWPELWVAIDRPEDVERFRDELDRELNPGHPLRGLPLRPIARRWDDIHVLFAIEDGTGRFALVLLMWRPGALDPAIRPFCKTYEDFEQWRREMDLNNLVHRLSMQIARGELVMEAPPKFRVGDRVLMLQHSDWKTEARATITREGRPIVVYDASIHYRYCITFDEPQTELSEELRGVVNLYDGTTVLEEYLRTLDAAGSP